MKSLLAFSLLLLLCGCSSSVTKENDAIIEESFHLTEQSEDSILNFAQKCYDLGIEDRQVGHTIDVALKYVRLQEDYHMVMNSISGE